MLVLLNKPFDTLCQFSRPDGLSDATATLADFVDLKGIYPAGRLDRDSEGLVLLTDDGRLQHRLSHPRHGHWKSYWVQVEGAVDAPALDRLRRGIELKDGPTRPARARSIEPPAGLWEREPPIRKRAQIPTSWIELTIREGRNRQIRRMTAAVGFPTLRLIRHRIGDYSLDGLTPGQWRAVKDERAQKPPSKRR